MASGVDAVKFPRFSLTYVRPCPHVVDDDAIWLTLRWAIKNTSSDLH